MDGKKVIALFALGVAAGLLSAQAYQQALSPQQKRQRLIEDMQELIDEKSGQGEYACCIEPACDMCYLGHWIWDDGECDCDEMIAKGEYEKVCPQCAKKEGEGQCDSDPSVEAEMPVCEIEG